ncbi:competence/damage-inducible protein cinA [Microbacterium testaceum StLB037]|jgi:nicotinamide-nucleotide amidase|uniref:Competence/damage-inducible protein cinA n=1 Tax=Microbacterium testaceum (strain StLB037) TaxID=979556 RepID=A0A1H0LA75_MICTS|nr:MULTISPECIES: CinA family protein [Microbacterium]KQM40375.1 damage-inducible protein CinA [Microbacterium sp. Leaf203]SDO64840.1 competence/damage-inducible protein cinA [Microbacterium testaceum StLB037]
MIDGIPDDLDETLVRTPRESAALLLERLGELGWTIGVAESLTGGLVVSSLVDVPGASRAVRGGVVAYATDLKHGLLGVDQTLLDAHGAVHPRVARQMARGVRDVLGRDGVPADVGIATTGVAGPDEQDGQPVGTVHIAVSTPLGTRVDSLVIAGDRERIRRETAHLAIRRALAAL